MANIGSRWSLYRPSKAIWFWSFQNTYYAISTSKLKGLPKMYSGVIDVSGAWLE